MDSNQKSAKNGTPVTDRIKILLTHVCEQGKDQYKPNIQKLYKNLINIYESNAKDQQVIDVIQNYFVECVSLLQFKSSIYATTLCEVAQNSSTLSSIILDGIFKALQKHLDNFNLDQSKCLLLFIGQLMNIGLINSFQFITILYALINEAENIESQNQDFYLYLIITILPYLYENLAEKSAMDLKNLQENIDAIISKRTTNYSKCQLPFHVENPQDLITVFWRTFQEEIQTRKIQEFTSNLCVVQFHVQCKDDLKNLKQISQANKFYFKDRVAELNNYQAPFQFAIFSDNSLKSLVIKIALEDLIKLTEFFLNIIFRAFWEKKTLLIKNLTNLMMFEMPVQDYIPLLVETIFNQLLLLPKSPCKQILFSSLVIGLIEESKQLEDNEEFEKLLKQHVNDAFVNFFIPQLPEMDFELILRLLNFLAHILSYDLKLIDWAAVQTKLSPELNSFLSSLFHKISLISSVDLTQEIPEMSEYFPNSEWKTNLMFSNLEGEEETAENIQIFQDYQIVKEQLAKKISSIEMINFLSGDNLENSSNSKLIKQIFLESFLERVHKSIGFIKILIERYRDVFLQFVLSGDKEESQMLIMNQLRTFWKYHQKQIVIYTSKFLDYKILDPAIVIKWLFVKFLFEEKENIQQNTYILNELIYLIFDKLQAQIVQQQFVIKSKEQTVANEESNKKDENKESSEEITKIDEIKLKLEASLNSLKKLIISFVNTVYSALESNPDKLISTLIINSFVMIFRLYKQFAPQIVLKIEEQFQPLFEIYPEVNFYLIIKYFLQMQEIINSLISLR